MARFKRILLKLSGESLMGSQGYGIDPERLSDYAKQIKEVAEMGVQIGIVIGGGNIFRGLSGSQKGFDRVKGDQMGMCATVINSLALSSALLLVSSIRNGRLSRRWNRDRCASSLQEQARLISLLIRVLLCVALRLRPM